MSSLSSYGPHWDTLKKIVLDRDGRRCMKCGEYGNHVHHIVPRSKGGKDHPANLITLCTRHHAEKHPHLHRKIYGTKKLQER